MAFIGTGSGNDTIVLGGSGNAVYAGANSISGGTGDNTLGLPTAGHGLDTISGFTETNGDILDLRAALAATTWNGRSATPGATI
ncbi:MAG TPA: hypothetical protein VFG12_07040 [Rhodopila sp.]|jgi:hypothetical protein|nr:hypothetical protein [Rhodopila sp.]